MKKLAPHRWREAARIVASILVLGLSSVAKAHHQSQDEGSRLRYEDQSVLVLGKTVYQQHCANCHGRNLEGQRNWHKRNENGYLPAPPHDATGHTWHHADTLLFKMTKYGPKSIAGEGYKTRMPAYENILSDHDIVAVLSYIKSQWPKKLIRIHNEQINRSQ